MKFALIALLFLGLVGCNEVSNSPRGQIIDFGNGVFYTTKTGNEFGYVLSSFRTTHNVISIAPNDASAYGMTCGYFIICEDTTKVQNNSLSDHDHGI